MFSKLTMKMRLMLVVVPLILVLASLGLLGLTGLKSSNQALFNVYEDGMVDFSHIAMIDQLMARARGDSTRPLFDEEDEAFADSVDKLTRKVADIREEYAKFLGTGLSSDEKAQSEEFGIALEAYLKDGLEPTIVALRQKDRMALRLVYTDKVEPLYAKARQPLAKLEESHVVSAQADYEAAVKAYDAMRNLFIAVITLAMAYGLGAGWLIVRNLTRELGGEPSYAREVARRIASGDLA